MKKQFFYAAMAMAMLSSCSKDNDPGSVTPEPESNGKVAIELGIKAPTVTAKTRASGTVGGMTDETNLWKGQTLNIVAYDKGTSTKTVDSETITEANPTGNYIFDGLTFKAPTQTWNTELVGGKSILILKDEATIQAVYYNPTGNMDFYGYHIDNLTGTLTDDTKTVSGITITGAEDLLGAKTKEVNDTNYPDPVTADNILAFNAVDPVRGFSAWAARRNIQPILNFQHLLTRLTFTVTAAKADAAQWYWDATGAGAWVENKSTETDAGSQSSTAVQVTKITIKDVRNGMEIVLDGTEAGKTYPYAASTAASATADLSLQQRNATTSAIETLAPMAPAAFDNSGADHSGSWTAGPGLAYSIKTPVGESLMIPAGDTEIKLVIELQQKVVDTEAIADGTKTYKVKKGVVNYTLPYSAVTSGVANITAFTAGYSYNVNINVFSFERIDITAELAKWQNGGDFDFDAE